MYGEYKGKDLFVQNPFNRKTQSFCTQEVYVNDKMVLENPKVSAYKIDLSHLQINDLVVVRIEFLDDCRPSVINPEVLHPSSRFEFVSTEADNHVVTWVTMGEVPGGSFFIEQLQKSGEWIDIARVNGKGETSNNEYSEQITHLKGKNHYRIRYSDHKGKITYSLDTYYLSTKNPITFSPSIATTQLTLSDTTSYEIEDYYGRIVKKGRGKSILVSDLNPGEYYLIVQFRKEKFIKK